MKLSLKGSTESLLERRWGGMGVRMGVCTDDGGCGGMLGVGGDG